MNKMSDEVVIIFPLAQFKKSSFIHFKKVEGRSFPSLYETFMPLSSVQRTVYDEQRRGVLQSSLVDSITTIHRY